MRKLVTRTLSFLLCAATLAATAGCSGGTPQRHAETEESSEIGEFAFVELEYELFLARKASSVLNQISSRLAGIQAVTAKNGNRKTEKEAAENSLEIIQDCRNSIEKFKPSSAAGKRKQNILDILDETIETFENYIIALDGGGDLDSFATAMEQESINLQANIDVGDI